MESYSALAASYDELTQDVGYEKRAAFVEKLFLRSHIPVHTVLDLACGTGTMTALLTERGYELIGVDGSEDMLLEAREKAFNERYNEYRLEVEGMIKELKSSLKDETEKSAAVAKERDKAAEALSEARAASQSAELEKLRKELTELRRSSAETLKRAERAEKERDKARAKADENSLSKYIIDRLSGKK